MDDEEHYFGDRRKERKQERKQASAKDRSKFKKTDRMKWSQATTPFSPPTGTQRGRVVQILSEGVVVQREEDAFRIVCGLRGSLKQEMTLAKNLVGIGDYVWLSETGKEEGVIACIEPRRTILTRADNLSRRKEQLIAANIDQVLISTSVVNPGLKPSLVDRYIIATEKGGMVPIIVVNKIDLLVDHLDQEVFYREFITVYRAIGYTVVGVSASTGEGLDQLRNVMKHHSSVFAGQSGVGKSSLINAMTGLTLPTGEMAVKTGKGAHTTTHAQLIALPFGGFCVDTPGIKSFGVWDLDKSEIEAYFPDIFEAGTHCRFADCSHTGESGCAVLEAVNCGTISPIRFDSYCGLIASMSEKHRRR